MALLLVADDDRAIRDALRRAFTVEGYDTLAVSDGIEVCDALVHSAPDLFVLDVMMPHMDGLTLCRQLREAGVRTPILVLTALSDVADRVAGLDAGADDYLAKPFDLDELLARVRALLRRQSDPVAASHIKLTLGDIVLDTQTREVAVADTTIELTKTEFDLLELLMSHPGEVLSPQRIYLDIWGYDFGTGSKNLAVYVNYLRRKLEGAGLPRMIHNRRGMGYVIKAP